MPASRLRFRAEELLLRGLGGALALLPERVADAAGAGLGRALHSLVRVRRGTVRENLRRAFPDASAAEVARISAGAYRHLGREAVAILRLARSSPRAIVESTEMRGWDEFQAALAEGRGALMVTGHLGNWEIGAAAVAARGVPVRAVVRGQTNPRVTERLNEVRARLGVWPIDQAVAPRAVPRALRAGMAVGIVADQDARNAGVWVPFFGHPASTYRGPALFAVRFGAPLFACAAVRLPGSRPRYAVELRRVEVESSGEAELDVARLTAALALDLERSVRRHPDQYFWLHRRWKTAPPEPPSAGDGTTTLDDRPPNSNS
jgi:Kdo2-lipid IVA lauroyltransferase/acyltransferase